VSSALRLVELAHASNTGRVRTQNEDRSLAAPRLLAVADGMGGAKAGEVAAEITVEAIAAIGDAPSVEALRGSLVDANRRIRAVAEDDPARAGMGTTVTAALLDDDGTTLMHVGDSRAYLLRDGVLRQITDDHSIVAEMVRQGQISPDEAARHPSRNIITRALGAEQDVQIDEVRLDLVPGDVVLLCTDGLSSMVDDALIEETTAGAATLADAATALIEAALEHGGNDNVTVVLARIGEAGDGAPEITGVLPAIDTSRDAESTQALRIPQPPVASPNPARTPRVLERTTSTRGGLARRIVGLGAIILLLLGAFGAWASSRSYFVDGEPEGTVRVYHGAPFDIFGVNFFAEWGDTGVATATVAAAEPATLGRSVRGQGEAVHRAVDIVWKHGLPQVPEITVPPAPAKAAAGRSAQP
jgi:serine/threonine protein phosphatase PrpC